MEQSKNRPSCGSALPGNYGRGVRAAIDWILGDTSAIADT
jgi:hypothetical protein